MFVMALGGLEVSSCMYAGDGHLQLETPNPQTRRQLQRLKNDSKSLLLSQQLDSKLTQK